MQDQQQNLPDNPVPRSIQAAYLLALAKSDSATTFDWLQSHDLALYYITETGVMGKLMTDDPARVASIYLKRGLEKGDVDDLKEVVTGWAHTDSTKAAEWVAKHVDEPEMQSALLADLELSSARTNPESHAEGLVGLSDSPQNRQLADLVASRWAHKAPDKAAQWAAKIDKGFMVLSYHRLHGWRKCFM